MKAEFSSTDKKAIETYASEFFQEDTLTSLFMDLYEHMKALDPDIIFRGRKEEIVGISFKAEKYLFYVVHSDDGFSIKFKSRDKEDYRPDNAEMLHGFALEELLKHNNDPEPYLLGIQKYEKSQQITNSDTTGTKRTDIHETIGKQANRTIEYNINGENALYNNYGVDPAQFKEIPISKEAFSVRAYNCLMRSGITTIELLLYLSEDDLLKLNQLGKKTQKEIVSVLEAILESPYQEIKPEPAETITANDPKEDKEKKAVKITDLIKEEILRKSSVEHTNTVMAADCEEYLDYLYNWIQNLFDIIHLDEFIVHGRERTVFYQRFIEGKTLQEIGDYWKVSRERIRQITARANRKLNYRIKKYPSSEMKDSLEDFYQVLCATDDDVFMYSLTYGYDSEKYKTVIIFLIGLFFSKKEGRIMRDEIKKLRYTTKRRKDEIIVRKKEERIPPVPTGRNCPRCGAELVIRTAQRGETQGRKFIGCSAFPNCWYKERYHKDDN